METLTQCSLCGKEIAKHTCTFCGKSVCSKCYGPDALCKSCRIGKIK